MYQIGKITSTHGIRGEVKIYNLSDFDRFFVGANIYIKHKNGEQTFFEIEKVRIHKGMFIVKFAGYDNINDVLIFKDHYVYSDDSIEDQLEADDYHYEQIIGKKVILEDKTVVGIVSDLIEVPQGHLLEVKKTDGKKRLIPFIKDYVGEIDDESITIMPIEGLL